MLLICFLLLLVQMVSYLFVAPDKQIQVRTMGENIRSKAVNSMSQGSERYSQGKSTHHDAEYDTGVTLYPEAQPRSPSTEKKPDEKSNRNSPSTSRFQSPERHNESRPRQTSSIQSLDDDPLARSNNDQYDQIVDNFPAEHTNYTTYEQERKSNGVSTNPFIIPPDNKPLFTPLPQPTFHHQPVLRLLPQTSHVLPKVIANSLPSKPNDQNQKFLNLMQKVDDVLVGYTKTLNHNRIMYELKDQANMSFDARGIVIHWHIHVKLNCEEIFLEMFSAIIDILMPDFQIKFQFECSCDRKNNEFIKRSIEALTPIKNNMGIIPDNYYYFFGKDWTTLKTYGITFFNIMKSTLQK